ADNCDVGWWFKIKNHLFDSARRGASLLSSPFKQKQILISDFLETGKSSIEMIILASCQRLKIKWLYDDLVISGPPLLDDNNGHLGFYSQIEFLKGIRFIGIPRLKMLSEQNCGQTGIRSKRLSNV
ncbi:MAG: hypothetical protein AAGC85_27125, partial [Bacteroidota bacterium]